MLPKLFGRRTHLKTADSHQIRAQHLPTSPVRFLVLLPNKDGIFRYTLYNLWELPASLSAVDLN